MSTINYVVYSDHLGDNTDAMNAAYISKVQEVLSDRYPESDVTVDLHNGSGYRNGGVSGFDDDESVLQDCNEVANDIWGRADYYEA